MQFSDLLFKDSINGIKHLKLGILVKFCMDLTALH